MSGALIARLDPDLAARCTADVLWSLKPHGLQVIDAYRDDDADLIVATMAKSFGVTSVMTLQRRAMRAVADLEAQGSEVRRQKS